MQVHHRLGSPMLAAVLAAGSLGFAAAPAPAQDTQAQDTQAPSTAATPAPAEDDFTGKSGGDFMVRLRGLAVIPRDHADYIDPIGGDTTLSTTYVPELDLTYFITDYIAVEAIAAVTKHHAHVKNSSIGDVDLGSIWLLPPTITLQYHPLPKERFSPYLGAGVNYTFFFNDNVPDDGPVKSIHYQDSFGFALQAGLDIAITNDFYFNVDVKRLWLNDKVKINGGDIKAKVDVDPWIVGAGFGYKF